MRSFLTSRIFIFFIVVLFLIVSFVALLPSLISTSWGQKKVTEWVNRNIAGEIKIRNLHLQWSGGQTIEGFLLKDKKDDEGLPIVEFEKLSTDATLWQIIRGSTHLGYSRLQDLDAFIITDEKGISNLQYALGLDQTSEYAHIPASTITLSNVNGELHLFSNQKPLSLHLTGTTRQDQLAGSFEIEAELPGLQLEDWSSFEKQMTDFFTVEGSREAHLQAKIDNFPVDLIDRIVALKRPELNGFFRSILGDKLNVFLDKEPNSEGLAFNLTILAPLFQGNLKGKIANNQFNLQDPALFYLELNPDSINPFVQPQFRLLEPLQMTFRTEELSFPLSFFDKNANTDPCAISIKGDISTQNQPAIEVTPIGNVKLMNVKATVDSPVCSDGIHLKVQGQASNNGNPLDINFESILSKPSHLKDVIHQLQENSHLTLQVSHLPLQFLSTTKDQSKLLETALGSYADLKVTAKQIESSQFDLFISLKTEKITLNQVRFRLDKDLVILSPAVIEYSIEPELANPFLAEHELALIAPSYNKFTIFDLRIPLENIQKGIIKGELKTDAIHVTHLPSSNQVHLNNIQIKLDGLSLDQLNIQLLAQTKLISSDPIQSNLLGAQGQLSISSQVLIGKNNQISLSQFKTHFESPQSTLYLEGNLLPNYQFVLTQPLQLQYRLLPHVLNKIVDDTDYPKLQKEASIYFKADPFQFNIKDLQLTKLAAKGSLSIDSLVFHDSSGAILTLDEVDMPWEINPPLNMIRINPKGRAYTNKYSKPSQINAQFLVSNWIKDDKYDLSALKIEVISNFIGLPTVLISSLALQEDLTPLFGSILDMELTALIDRKEFTPGYWDMILDSPQFHLKARLKFGEAITLYESTSKAAEIRWTMTPEGYKYLGLLLDKDLKGIDLESPVTFKAFFSDLYIPLKNTKSPLANGKFNVNFETTDFVWVDSNLPVYKMKGQFHTPNVMDHINFIIQANSKETSNFIVNGKLSHLFDKTGQKDFQQSDLNLNVKANQLPTSLAQVVLNLDETQKRQFQALFGKEIDVNISTQLQHMDGPVTSVIEGKNGKISLDGFIQQKTLFLKKPFEGHFHLTPELNQIFFKEQAPILTSITKSSDPIKIVIDPKDFSLPIFPIDVAHAQVGKGALHLNQLQVRNEGDIKSILNLLKPINEKEITIWFTPIYFRLAKEKLTIHRFDFLVAQTYSFALWGQLQTKSNKLDLTLGVTEQSLKQAFGIQGIDPNYILQVPIKGRKGQIDIDKGKAITQIAALTAQSEGNTTTKILGGVLGLAAGLNDGEVPKPTTIPPWMQQSENTTSTSKQTSDKVASTSLEESKKGKQDSKSKKKKSDDWFDEIEKGASTLIDLLSQPSN